MLAVIAFMAGMPTNTPQSYADCLLLPAQCFSFWQVDTEAIWDAHTKDHVTSVRFHSTAHYMSLFVVACVLLLAVQNQHCIVDSIHLTLAMGIYLAKSLIESFPSLLCMSLYLTFVGRMCRSSASWRWQVFCTRSISQEWRRYVFPMASMPVYL